METTTRKKKPSRKRRPAPAGKQRPSQELKRKKRPVASAAKKRTAPVRPRRHNPDMPRVVYTPPKPFSRSTLVLRLATVVAVVLALTFGLSIFFKVENITVSGAVKYDPWTVKEASGIEIGDNLLSFGETKACAKIKIALPYVDKVRIGIKLPDTVNIEIQEFDMLYSIRDAAGAWWLITSEGIVVDKVDSAAAGERTQIQGVRLGGALIGQPGQAQEDTPPPTTEGTEPTSYVPQTTAADRLRVALEIAGHLESCGILGDIASIDVEDLGNLEVWYGTRFLVKLGNADRLDYKIKCMDAAINGTDPLNSLKEYDSGTLDISFTIKEDQLIYQTFTDKP